MVSTTGRLLAQPPHDTTLAKQLLASMEAQYNTGRFDSALHYGNLALPLLEEAGLWPEAAQCLLTTGYAAGQRGDFTQAKALLDKGMELGLTHLPETQVETSRLFGGQVALRVWQGDYAAAIPWSDRQIAFLGEEENIPAAGAYINRGISFYYLSRLPECIEACHKGVQMLKNLDQGDHLFASNAYLCLGRAHYQLRQYARAENYFLQALTLARQKLGPHHPNMAHMYQSLADLEKARNHYAEAVAYLRQAQEIYRARFGAQNPWMALSYFNLGRIAFDQANYDTAAHYFEQAIAIQEAMLSPLHPERVRTRLYLARTRLVQLDTAAGSRLLESLLSVDANESRDLIFADVLETYGRLLHAQGRDSLAETAFNQALDLLGQGQAGMAAAQKTAVLGLLHQKALVQMAEGELEDLKAALATYQQAVQLIDEMASRQDPVEEDQYGRYAALVFQKAVALAYACYRQTGEKAYLEEAFTLAEKNRASLLRQGTRAVVAQHFAGVPDSVLRQERAFRAELAFARQKWREAEKQGDSLALATWQGRRAKAQNAADSLHRKIALQYPDYYRLKYDPGVSSLKEVQEALPGRKTTLLEYFWSDSSLFLFVVKRNHSALLNLGKAPSLHRQVQDFLQGISDAGQVFNNGYAPETLAALHGQGLALYKRLLAPAFGEGMVRKGDKLIVIPDGILGLLPFEALPMNAGGERYANWDYLLQHHVLRYAYAATLLAEPSPERGRPQRELAGFAPDYSLPTERPGFPPLQYNREEVRKLISLLEGEAFLDQEASEAQFKAQAGQYRLLHLAMHTLLNDTLPMYSGLVFTQPLINDSSTSEHQLSTVAQPLLSDGFLHAYEVYNLPLRADLVVLSACQTGYGRLRQGEGIMSLAHAFRYAGCANTVVSLWPVDDQSTSRLMETFYSYLGQGLAKDEALTRAKQDYLAAPGQHHPFFWAGLVLLGDDQPVRSPFPWAALTLGLLAAGLIWVGMRRG